MDIVRINEDIEVGRGRPFLLIAGPCVLESESMGREVAAELKAVCADLGVNYVFKASFDKANRTSLASYRGPGLDEGIEALGRIRETGVAVVSDVHEPGQVERVAEVLDIIQIPAFLCRQTDLLVAAARSGRAVGLKKGQFMAPWDMRFAVAKVKESGNNGLLLLERGVSFGYNNLVVDMRAFPIMRDLGCPVVFDATHSVQLPGGAGGSSGGERRFVAPLARAAAAVGIDGLFMEVHPDPDKALCDGPNSMPLAGVKDVLKSVLAVRRAVGADPRSQ